MGSNHNWQPGVEKIEFNERNNTNRVTRTDKCRNCDVSRVFLGHFITGKFGREPAYFLIGNSPFEGDTPPVCMSRKDMDGID